MGLNNSLPVKGRGGSLAVLIGSVLLVLVLGLLWVWHQHGARQGGAQHAMGPVPVGAAPIATKSIADVRHTVGTLLSDESVIVRPEVTGRIDGIHFKEGQNVKARDVLLTLDPRMAKASLADGEARLVLTKQIYDRTHALHGRGYASAEKQDQATAAYLQSQAVVAERRVTLDKMTVRAPFDGTVGFRSVSLGDYVGPGQDLVNLVALDDLKVDFALPDKDMARLTVGQPIHITTDSFPGESFDGVVTAINPQVGEGGRQVMLRGRVPNKDRRLKPGMFVRVAVDIQRFEGAVVVPEEAIVPQGTTQFIYTIQDGKAVLNPATLGLRQDGWVQVLSSLPLGGQVITSGHMKLRPGAPVQVVPPPSKGSVAPKANQKTEGTGR